MAGHPRLRDEVDEMDGTRSIVRIHRISWSRSSCASSMDDGTATLWPAAYQKERSLPMDQCQDVQQWDRG